MVTKPTRRRITFWCIALVALAICVGTVLVPFGAINRSDPYVRLLSRALAAFHAEHGRYPKSLIEVQPYLSGGTILQLSEREYKVEIIQAQLRKIYVLEVRYRLNSQGGMEEFYARVIDKRNN